MPVSRGSLTFFGQLFCRKILQAIVWHVGGHEGFHKVGANGLQVLVAPFLKEAADVVAQEAGGKAAHDWVLQVVLLPQVRRHALGQVVSQTHDAHFVLDALQAGQILERLVEDLGRL